MTDPLEQSVREALRRGQNRAWAQNYDDDVETLVVAEILAAVRSQPVTDGLTVSEGDHVICEVPTRGPARREIRCVVVDPHPFRIKALTDREDRLRVRCIDEHNPMNGIEFVPFLSSLRPAREGS